MPSCKNLTPETKTDHTEDQQKKANPLNHFPLKTPANKTTIEPNKPLTTQLDRLHAYNPQVFSYAVVVPISRGGVGW
jgi:hypothetical protein